MSDIDYKLKAAKYKTKYLNLKKQLESHNLMGGGHEEWYTEFDAQLKEIYTDVNGVYGDEGNKIILTGSCIIAYLLKYLNMTTELDTLNIELRPNDVDLLYNSEKKIINRPTIGGKYNILKESQETEQSATYNLIDNTKYIKSFDITKYGNIKTFVLDGIRIIDLYVLRDSFYRNEDFEDSEETKIKKGKKRTLINQIIEQVKLKGLEEAFGLKKVETPNTAPKGSSMFGPDSDDEGDFAPPGKLNFGADSDDEMGGGGFNGSDTIRSQDLNISD
jgi:hypothetical protein